MFRNGRNQAIRTPREFEIEGEEVIIHKEGDRVILEPVRKGKLLPWNRWRSSFRILMNCCHHLMTWNFNLEEPADQPYGELRADLEKRGTTIGPNDMLIAAHALMLDCVVVTANVREFSRVHGLRVENWLQY